MSKSLGNFVTIADVLKDWPGEVARFNMLKTHYRQPIDWTNEGLVESQNTLLKWRRRLEQFEKLQPVVPTEIMNELCDDLDTPAAFRRMTELAFTAGGMFFGGGSTPKPPTEAEIRLAASKLLGAMMLFGLWVEVRELTAIENGLITARLTARAAKDWKESDRIRDELTAMGIQIKDVKDLVTGEMKTEWEVKR